MLEERAVLFWGGAGSTGRKGDPSQLPILSPFPQSCTQPFFAAGQNQGSTGRRASLPPRASHSQDAFLAGPSPPQRSRTSLREPWSFGSHWEPQVAPREPATSSLQEDALSPAPSQPTGVSPQGQPSRAPFSRTHRPAALGSPASGRPGPVGGGGGVEAGPPSARGALRGRADAQARSRPRSRTDSPSAHPHAHAGGARRAGSAADASAEARGIPGMRRRPPSAGSAGLRLARQDTPPDTPLPRAGGRPSPGESAGRRGRGLARRGEACFPSPARRTPRGSSHLPGGCGRAPAGNVRCGPGAALGPREEAPVAKGARARHLRRIYVPQGPAVGNTPFSVHAQTNLSCAPGCLLLWASHVPHTHTVGPRTQWTQHT